MARASWINDESHPEIEAHLSKLEHFTNSMADGVIDDKELAQQETNLIAAMKAVEGSLSDEQHAQVTKLLAELAAYSVMQTMHDLMSARTQERARQLKL
jgi:predicted transcriptional regulator